MARHSTNVAAAYIDELCALAGGNRAFRHGVLDCEQSATVLRRAVDELRTAGPLTPAQLARLRMVIEKIATASAALNKLSEGTSDDQTR
jgi:hypothetical protein